MRFRLCITLLATGLLGTTSAGAQNHRYDPNHDPVRIKYQDSRQYRGEPKGNARKRDTRCKIVVRKGQDKRVCGVPTNYAVPKR
jgi:hypothetical protein